MAHIREIIFRYVPKFSITKNIIFSNQKKIANNLVKYLKKLKYLKINNWVVKPASSGKTGKSYQKERIKKPNKVVEFVHKKAFRDCGSGLVVL